MKMSIQPSRDVLNALIRETPVEQLKDTIVQYRDRGIDLTPFIYLDGAFPQFTTFRQFKILLAFLPDQDRILREKTGEIFSQFIYSISEEQDLEELLRHLRKRSIRIVDLFDSGMKEVFDRVCAENKVSVLQKIFQEMNRAQKVNYLMTIENYPSQDSEAWRLVEKTRIELGMPSLKLF